MNFEEFLQPREQAVSSVGKETDQPTEIQETPELEVQKTVVEELAADKAALDDEISEKTKIITELKSKLEAAIVETSRLQGEILRLRDELSTCRSSVESSQAETARVRDELAAERERQLDLQSRNPNALALLDREVELPDRFPGETRDHVIESLREARDRAEAEGRLRCAQILEGVLLANEPNGTLAEKRSELKRIFVENGNVINGTVIEELKKRGLAHKNGDDYLLVDEIIRRAY